MEMIAAFVLFGATVFAWFVLPGSPVKLAVVPARTMEHLGRTA
jgi:hypothetical protein